MLEKKSKRIKRHRRVRAKIKGDSKKPRLCVFRSSNHVYAQLIDDNKGKTIIAVNDLDLGKKAKEKKISIARQVGILLGEKAKEKKIGTVVFDRGGYKYHGRIKALAEGAREAGLKF
ncbi:MAG: 50S ribosomal protein L18 [Candidatus Paceibacterota bacterium]|jgi:large subunit ribosomal protein L18|nr:50S ribosomal protein L18 [Candidatus Paceibacterota bacterium]MDD5555280.1 50S ribosomal protein L18 [Candidatus Paceibacterota bacterium]